MGKQRNRTRTNSSVEQLPADLKLEVDCMLGDYRNTYDSICKYIKENGYSISRSSLCRYAKKIEAGTGPDGKTGILYPEQSGCRFYGACNEDTDSRLDRQTGNCGRRV